jgi:ribonuclease R
MLLRSMQQAVYTASNAGHFGLAYGAYTHFTSPIRRYPDLLVHRVIKALLGARKYHLEVRPANEAPTVRRGGKLPVKAPLTQELGHWEAVGAHCSANERRADEASRDVEAWLKCRYMGEEFAGTISSVAAFGLFVTLDSLHVDGLVHITELGGEYYRFDELRQDLRGERTGVRYAVGGRVRVQVSRVDLDGRKIDFRMVREGELERPLPAARTERSRSAGGAVGELAAIKATDRAGKAAVKAKAKGKTRKRVEGSGEPVVAQGARPAGARKASPRTRARR